MECGLSWLRTAHVDALLNKKNVCQVKEGPANMNVTCRVERLERVMVEDLSATPSGTASDGDGRRKLLICPR